VWLELRKGIRYVVDAPAVFSWQSGPYGCFQGEGITRDISVQGAFIVTATMPPPDCPVQVDLILPSVSGMNAAVRITGKARVIRVEHRAAAAWNHGFAVATDGLNQWGLIVMHDESECADAGASRPN
jgi:hypothetical protein